ncbi:MAG: hypothetical protein FJ035_08900 [Chloroflexi bacterium]|nr:hypothetical protein [Chloroflexota bacterium]
MATYIGFYHIDPEFQRDTGARARNGDNSADLAFQRRMTKLRDTLRAGLKLIGSWGTSSNERPNVWICETDAPRHL